MFEWLGNKIDKSDKDGVVSFLLCVHVRAKWHIRQPSAMYVYLSLAMSCPGPSFTVEIEIVSAKSQPGANLMK